MSSLENLKNKMKVTKELLFIVKTMKALAGSSIRRYQKAYEASKVYVNSIEMGFQILLNQFHQQSFNSKKSHKFGAIIFGSDLGMCGKFNDQISDFAKNFMNQELKIPIENQEIITIGEHVTKNFFKYDIEQKFMFPISAEGIEKILIQVLNAMEKWILEKKINEISLFYNKPVSESTYKSCVIKILPLNEKWLNDLKNKKWESNQLPTFFIDQNILFSSLTKEYIYMSLHQAFIESLLSENISRLAAMKYAENNILQHLDELTLFYNREWQISITSEILEIIEGYETVKNK